MYMTDLTSFSAQIFANITEKNCHCTAAAAEEKVLICLMKSEKKNKKRVHSSSTYFFNAILPIYSKFNLHFIFFFFLRKNVVQVFGVPR